MICVARTPRAKAFRFSRACASGCRTSRCIEHLLPGVFARLVGPPPDPLALEQVEEALRNGIVMAVAAAAHRMLKIVCAQERCPVHAGELTALDV